MSGNPFGGCDEDEFFGYASPVTIRTLGGCPSEVPESYAPLSGVGVPAGGTINQVLSKASSNNFDLVWVTPAALGVDFLTLEDLVWANITNKPPVFEPAVHIHAITDVTGLQAALDSKQAAGSYSLTTHNHNAAYADINHTHATLYAPISHTHAINNITGLQAALDDKAAATHNHDLAYAAIGHNHTGTYALVAHSHAIADVTGLQAALDGKQAAGSYAPLSHTHIIADVTGLQAALDSKPTLDGGGKVAAAQLPSYVDDVIEAANFAALPVTGETSKIYVTLDNNKTYRWSGSVYVEISASPGSTDVVPEGATNLYYTDARAQAALAASLATKVPMVSEDTYVYKLVKGVQADKSYGGGVSSNIGIDPWSGSGSPGFIYANHYSAGAVYAGGWSIGTRKASGRTEVDGYGDVSGFEFNQNPYVLNDVIYHAGNIGAVLAAYSLTSHNHDASYAALGHTHDYSAVYQPLDAQLTDLAALAYTANGSKVVRVNSGATAFELASLVKADVGLANVDNTSDANKPISTATQTALDGKQPLDAQLTSIAGLDWTANAGKVIKVNAGATGFELAVDATGGGGLSDGDYTDITISGGATVFTIDPGVVTLSKMADMATSSLIYRKTAGTGVPEVQTLATLKTDLGLTGTNSGDQTTISGNAGSATILATGRTIGMTGDVVWTSPSFDGSGNVTAAGTIQAQAVTLAKMANVATDTIFYRKTAGTGVPEVQTLATLKTDLGLTGTNSGDQTSIVGITGSLAEFNTALTGADFATGGGTATGTNTGDQTITLTGDVTGGGTGSFAATIAADAVTYAKIQNVSATDKLLGRSTAGAGDIEEIACTAAGRALLDDADASAQRTTLGLAAIAASGSGADLGTGTVTLAKIANIGTDRLLGRDTAASGVPEELTVGGGIEFTGTGGIQSSAFTGDVTKTAGGTALTIANDAVTFAKIQNTSGASKLLGRGSASGAGDVEEIILGTNLSMSGTTLNATGGGGLSDSDYGDITVSVGGTVMTIDAGVVTYAKMQDVSATDRLLGRSTAGAGDVEEITCTAAGRALLDDADASAQRTTLGLAAIAASGSGADLGAGTVTLAKMANISSDRLIGRDTAAAGVPEELTVGGGLEFTGTGGIQTSAFTGNVTKAAGGTALTIPSGTVTLAMMANMATDSFIGRDTAGSGVPEVLSAATTKTILALNNVDNTSDANKPVSTAQQTAIDLKLSRTPALQSVTSAATVTPTFDNDLVIITAQAVALTLANPTGTAIQGAGMVIRIKDNGTARAINYGTNYRAMGVTLPTTTVLSKTLYLGMIYNSTDTKWDVVSVAQQA